MRVTTTIATLVVRIAGPLQLVLGVLFWTGHSLSLVPFHMLIGSLFVLAIWTLCVLGARSGLRSPMFAALAWSLVLTALGMTQMRILPGPGHWVVRVVHLLTALVAMAQAQRLIIAIAKSPRYRPLREVHA
jgi:hypothetical protein